MPLQRRPGIRRSLGASLVAPESTPLGFRVALVMSTMVLEVVWVFVIRWTDAALHPLAPVGAGVMFLGVVTAALGGALVGLVVVLAGVLAAFLLLADFGSGTGAANAIVAAFIWCGATLTTGLVARYLRRQVARRETALEEALGRSRSAQDILERVLDFSPQFFKGETLREVAATICESAIVTFGAGSARVYILLDENIEVLALCPSSERVSPGLRLPLAAFPELDKMVTLSRPSFVRDVRETTLDAQARCVRDEFDIVSTVRLPIIGPEGPVGLIGLGWDHVIDRPAEEMLAIMQRFADQAAIAWQNALRLEAQERADVLHATLERVVALAPTFHITGSKEDVAQAVCQAAVATFGAARCSLYEVEGDRLRVLDRVPALQSLPRGRTFALSDDMPLAQEIRSRAPTFVADVDDPRRSVRPWPEEVIRQAGTRSVLYVPVRFTERGPQNLLVMTWNQAQPQPNESFLAVVQRFADQMALALTNAAAEQLHARLEASLLPTSPVEHPDLRVVTRYRTGEQRLRLGGDFVGSTTDSNGALHFVIGDVSGHGPDAAALGATLRSTWKALTLAGESIPKIVAVIRQMLLADRRQPHTFATLLIGMIDVRARGLRFVNAGHLPPLLIADEVSPCDSEPSAPLGVDAGVERPVLHFSLPERWSLFCYTDGLIDARLAPGSSQRYGEERLVERLRSWAGTGPDGPAVDRLMREIETGSGGAFADDVAVLLISTKDPQSVP